MSGSMNEWMNDNLKVEVEIIGVFLCRFKYIILKFFLMIKDFYKKKFSIVFIKVFFLLE